MSKRGIPAGAVVRGTDKGYDHSPGTPALKPGSERPVEQIDKKYPYMRPRDAATLILVRKRGKVPEVLLGCRARRRRRSGRARWQSRRCAKPSRRPASCWPSL